MAARTLDLLIKPVSTGFSLFSAGAGPHVRVDKSLRLRGGAAILLGLINPLAALLPLVDPGDEKAGEFAQLLARGAGAAAK